jgi:membrane protein implicated in regulation of membrane protease activity
LRRRFSRIFRGTVLNSTSDERVGKIAVVNEEITPDSPGRVRYQGTTWKAISYTERFKPGDKVEIIEEEDLTLIVSKPIIEDDDN